MKKVLLVFILLSVVVIPRLAAQSMTDDQLVKYVLQEKEKGTEQSVIIRNLFQRGVTTDQLRRVRKKVEAEQKQLGATDLTGKSSQTSRSNSRSRSQSQVERDNLQKKQNRMVRSISEEREMRYQQRDERMAQLEQESGFFDLDSVEYYSRLVPRELQVFGRNIFNQENLSFEPNMNMATPNNYRLGAGDAVIIDVWGASQQTFEDVVSPDGTVTIEGIGPIKLAGLSVSAAQERLRSRLSQYYNDCRVSLSIGEIRTIKVQVLGEVNMPGTYSISGLASAFNALYMAGGISDIGTLRDIKVYRDGRVIGRIDVYDYLLNGHSSGDVRLQDNDVIVVGPYDCLVEVRGKVKRPMFYEMKSTESVQRVIQYAGGFTGDAYTKNVRLVRKQGQEYSIHTIEEFDMNGFMLADGDSLFVDSVVPRYSNMVEVRGAVMHPGQFQMDGGIQSVRELLVAAEGLREDAFTERAVMHRLRPDLSLEMMPVNVQGILNGTAIDVPLKKNDVLFIPSRLEMQGELTFRINGEVQYPGTYQYAANTTVKDLILQAGGITRAASTAKVDVFRRIYQPDAESATTRLAQVFSVDIRDGFVIEDSVIYLEPFDEIQVRKSPTYHQQQNVKIIGSVNFEGEYAMPTKEFRLSELVNLAGGLSDLSYVKGARLVRELTESELEQKEILLKTNQISLFEQSLETMESKMSNNFDLVKSDSLLAMKLQLGEKYVVAIDLEDALAHPGGVNDITLRANDELIIPQYSNTVVISGEVMKPISINYKKGANLSYYLKRAGGTSNRASRKRTYVVYMNGSVKQLGRYDSGANIQPGCEIVVPGKGNRQTISTAEMTVLGTSLVSLSTMIITFINTIKK